MVVVQVHAGTVGRVERAQRNRLQLTGNRPVLLEPTIRRPSSLTMNTISWNAQLVFLVLLRVSSTNSDSLCCPQCLLDRQNILECILTSSETRGLLAERHDFIIDLFVMTLLEH